MNSVVIVAAGKGTRMGPDVDKLFLEVIGRPVVAHTWGQFDQADCVDEIILVVRQGMEDAFHLLAKESQFTKPYRLVLGGKERQDSVWNGLEALSDDAALVAIHDGARPCVTQELMESTFSAAEKWGAAVAAGPMADTIKQSSDGEFIEAHLQREVLWAVQTPQAFQVPVIRKALGAVQGAGKAVTDDTAACELIGQKVRLVPGKSPNPKVTVASDLPYVELLLSSRD